MPHASDLLPTDHDRHDALLVAALAARDLTGADRDLATDLLRTCTDCAALHDDLLAIAKATAVVPPPVTATPRDFRLTPADAARLRPARWRRLGDLVRAPRLAAMRPLGAGLTTLGLVGLLIGNVQVVPASPTAGSAGAGVQTDDGAMRTSASEHVTLSAPSGAVDTAGEPGTEVQPAASAAAAAPGDGPEVSAGAGGAAADATQVPSRDANGGSTSGLMTESTVVDPARPLNVLFMAAIVAGLALLVVARLRSRPTS